MRFVRWILLAVLASGRNHPVAMAVDRDAVYWAESDGSTGVQLVAVPKTGGAPTVLANVGANVSELVADGEYLFFLDPATGIVRRVSRRGGMAETIAWDEGRSHDLAVVGDWVYWLASFGRLRRISRHSGIAETVRRDLGHASSMAIAEDTLYVFDPWRGVMRYAAGALDPSIVLPCQGRAAKLIGRNGGIDVVVTGLPARRFATVPSTGTVTHLGADGAVVLASHQNLPGIDVAQSRGFLYWINEGEHELMRVSVSGGALERVAPAIRMAADESGVYVATAEGAIEKVK